MHKFAKFAIVTASAPLAGGIAVPMAQARPTPQYPECVDTSLRLNSRNSDTVASGTFCNIQK